MAGEGLEAGKELAIGTRQMAHHPPTDDQHCSAAWGNPGAQCKAGTSSGPEPTAYRALQSVHKPSWNLPVWDFFLSLLGRNKEGPGVIIIGGHGPSLGPSRQAGPGYFLRKENKLDANPRSPSPARVNKAVPIKERGGAGPGHS